MPSTDKDAEQLEHIAGGNANWNRHWGKHLAVSCKGKCTPAMWPSNLTPGDLPKIIENLFSLENLDTDFYSSSVNT